MSYWLGIQCRIFLQSIIQLGRIIGPKPCSATYPFSCFSSRQLSWTSPYCSSSIHDSDISGLPQIPHFTSPSVAEPVTGANGTLRCALLLAVGLRLMILAVAHFPC